MNMIAHRGVSDCAQLMSFPSWRGLRLTSNDLCLRNSLRLAYRDVYKPVFFLRDGSAPFEKLRVEKHVALMMGRSGYGF